MAMPHPVLIHIHGGPTAQALARVLPQDAIPGPRPVIIRPNVRGSTGYGAAFERLDDGMARDDAVRDIGAVLDWIDAQPDLDGSRVAVMGGSYGGFMALAALIRYEARFRCGVDMFGLTDLPRAIEQSDQGHFGDAQRGEYGDPADPAMRTYLNALSPVSSADRIGVPLLVYQGANDIRVKPEQSRLLVEKVRASGGEVVYI
jgi:dipeptidyl aminopeptidase/acylaminoacyl peptidase